METVKNERPLPGPARPGEAGTRKVHHSCLAMELVDPWSRRIFIAPSSFWSGWSTLSSPVLNTDWARPTPGQRSPDEATGLEHGFSMDNPSVAHTSWVRTACPDMSLAKGRRSGCGPGRIRPGSLPWFPIGIHIHDKRRAQAWPAHVRDKHVNLGSSDGVLPRKRNNNVTLEC